MAATSLGSYYGGSKGFYTADSCKVTTSSDADIMPYAEPENLADGEWREKRIFTTEDYFDSNPTQFSPRPDGSMDIPKDTSKMFYWEDYTAGSSWDWKSIYDRDLPDGDTYVERCLAYCISQDDCIMAATSEGTYNGGSKGFYTADSCKVTTSSEADIISYAEPENLIEGEWRKKVIYATKDYYESNRIQFPPQPDGSMDIPVDTSKMFYWKDYTVDSWDWKRIYDGDLPEGDT